MAEILGGLLAWLILGSLVSPVVMGAIMAAVAGIMVALSVDELMPLAKRSIRKATQAMACCAVCR